MNPQKTTTVIRLKRKTAEEVAIYASAFNMTPAELVEMAIRRWTEMTYSEAFGIDPKNVTLS